MVAVGLYLDLMKRALTRSGFEDNSFTELRGRKWLRHVVAPTQRLLARANLKLVRPSSHPTTGRAGFAPLNAETMIGIPELDNLQFCIEQVLVDDVPGDLIETGVWRGGATIFMRAVLAAYGVTDRTVWVADSFQGFPSDALGSDTYYEFAVSLDTVRANFARYGLLDEQVRFLAGWFKDTLPDAPFSQLAVARLDGDLYESTWDAMSSLYPRLSPGGFLIVDDYKLPACAEAIQTYRDAHGITDPIEEIARGAVFWRKSAVAEV